MSQILEPAGEALRVDVISDIVCPWCYVGKRQLEMALERWRAAHPDAPAPIVRWHPFQLNPDFPEAGMERAGYLQRKFGTSDPGAIYQRVQAAAEAVGLAPEFAKISRQPNTRRAHALVAAAPDEATQQAVVERMFRAYFIEGADLSSQDVLAALAGEAGLSQAQVEQAFDEASLAHIAQADAEARQLGVSGVPFFVIDGKLAASGAQGADALLAAFEQARAG
jgi:predicted DsbA family dithiol-disulfide isomerase